MATWLQLTDGELLNFDLVRRIELVDGRSRDMHVDFDYHRPWMVVALCEGHFRRLACADNQFVAQMQFNRIAKYVNAERVFKKAADSDPELPRRNAAKYRQHWPNGRDR